MENETDLIALFYIRTCTFIYIHLYRKRKLKKMTKKEQSAGFTTL